MKQALIALAVAAAALPMLIGVAGLPRPGDATAPAHMHVAAHYIAAGAEEAGAANLVTGVLLNYRAYDTFGEVMVIFAALAAVTAVLSSGAAAPPARQGPASRIGISPVVAFIIRLTAPFIAAFGVMVILQGHAAPGGGFQGGVILGALLVLLSVVLGRGRERPLIPSAVARWLQTAGPLAFIVVALLGLGLAGVLLGYPAASGINRVRTAMMLALEIGIGIGGAAIILGLFLQMRGD